MKTIEDILKEFNEQFVSNGEFIKGAWGTMPSEVEFFIAQQIIELLTTMPVKHEQVKCNYLYELGCECNCIQKEYEEWHNKVLGDDIQTIADKAAQAVREDLKKYDN